jgi:O-antigen/teichoic acid export membrane protein
MSTATKQAIKSNLWIGLGVLGGAFCAFLNYALAVRFLHAEDAGLLGVISSVITASVALGGLGFASALVREVTIVESDPARMRDSVGVALLLAVILGGLCLGLLFFGASTIFNIVDYKGDRASAVVYCSLCGFSVLLNQLTSVYRALAQSQCNFKDCTQCDLLYAALQLAGTFVLIRYPYLSVLGVINMAAAFVQLVVYWGQTRRVWGLTFFPKWSSEAFSRLWIFGRWMQIGAIMGIMGDALDKVVLAAYFGPASIPPYVLARRFYTQSHVLLASQAYYLFPKLSGKCTDGADRSDVNAGIECRTGGVIALAAGLIYTTAYSFGPLLVGWSVNEEVAAAVTPMLSLFCIIGWIQSLTLVTYFTKLAEGYSHVSTVTNLLAGPAALVAMILLGMTGHWYAAVSGQLLILIGILWLLGLGADNRSTPQELVRRLGIGIVPGMTAGVLCICSGATRSTFGLMSWPSIISTIIVCLIYLPLTSRLPRRWPNQLILSQTILRLIEQSPFCEKIRILVLATLGIRAVC